MMKKRDTSKKRNSIVDAAIDAFREDGYENTSMDRIAEVAGASKRTVYNHFPSKEALFEAVMERFMTEMAERKRIPYDPARSLHEQLSDFAAAKLDMVRNPEWRGILMVGMGSMFRDPELAARVMANVDESEQHMRAWFVAAHADGRLNAPDPEMAKNIFGGMVAGTLFWPQLFEGPMDPDGAAAIQREVVDLFLTRYQVR